MEKIVVTLWIMFSIYVLVLLAILADLWSGVRKAKKNGVARSSTPMSAEMRERRTLARARINDAEVEIERLKSEQMEEQQLIIER